jgi:hypothetical protein
MLIILPLIFLFWFLVTGSCVQTGPETERSSDNLLCFPAEHTVYPMTVKTSSNRFALKKRFSQFVSLDAQVIARCLSSSEFL